MSIIIRWRRVVVAVAIVFSGLFEMQPQDFCGIHIPVEMFAKVF